MPMEAEPERPYHIQAIYDLKDNYSPDHFRYSIRECREFVALVVADDDRSAQQVDRVNVLRYLDLLLSRAVTWIDSEADSLAIVLRRARLN